MPKKYSELERVAVFWSYIDIKEPNECWEWKKSLNHDGYGMFGVYKKIKLSHRYAYELYNNIELHNEIIRHKCDNPKCCNPYHLESGTQTDNIRDMIERNRRCSLKGEKNPYSFLTADIILEIRQKYSLGNKSYQDLAIEYNISRSHICNIIKKRAWSHL